MALELKIDLTTGKITPEPPPEAERDARANAVLEAVQGELEGLQARAESDARATLIQSWVLKMQLEAHPRNWLTDRSVRRTYNEVEEAVDNLRKTSSENLPEDLGDWLWEELAYVRDTLEKLYVKQRAEAEINHLILTPLGNLEHASINYQRMGADDLARVCQEVGDEVRRTADYDDQVLDWGPMNRGALLHGRDLVEIPESMQPSSGGGPVLIALGVLLLALGGVFFSGVIAQVPRAAGFVGLLGLIPIALGVMKLKDVAARRAALPGQFRDLSSRYRERLYLICALRNLDDFRSRYTRAQEFFRTHLQEAGGQQRWKKAKFDARDVTEVFATEAWDPRGTVEHWLAEKVKETYRLDVTKLVPPEEIDAEAWSVIQQAFELEREGTGSLTDTQMLDAVSKLLFTKRGEDTNAERAAVFEKVRKAWEASSLTGRGANA